MTRLRSGPTPFLGLDLKLTGSAFGSGFGPSGCDGHWEFFHRRGTPLHGPHAQWLA